MGNSKWIVISHVIVTVAFITLIYIFASWIHPFLVSKRFLEGVKEEKVETSKVETILEEKVEKVENAVPQSSHYEWQIMKWREAYLSGNYTSNIDIAVKLFGKEPMVSKDYYSLVVNKRAQVEHSYPFLTIDTLRVWIHW